MLPTGNPLTVGNKVDKIGIDAHGRTDGQADADNEKKAETGVA